MIKYKEGNILEAHVDALVNTVNTVGVMGKGIALQFKNVFPENFRAYKEAVKRNQIELGKVQVVPVTYINGVKYIINFPTKGHWKYPSKLEWIEAGLKDLALKIQSHQINSIALPPLGCGNGGLDWATVRPLIERILKDIDADVNVYEPSAAVKEALQKEEITKAAKLTPVRAMLLYLLYQYRSLGEFASEFAAEKLSYFLQRFGEKQLRLDFKKGVYGPYSGKVRHVLFALNGYYIKGYEQKDAKPFEPLELVSAKKDEVKGFIRSAISKAEQDRLNKVSSLIAGFESPYGLELLATVEFLIQENSSFNSERVLASLKDWSARKEAMFPLNHIEVAVKHLQSYHYELYTNE